MRKSYLLWLTAAVLGTSLGLSWSWLPGLDSPLRKGEIHAVEDWAPQIVAAAAEAGLQDPFLLAGLIYAESRGQADAISSIGALGLCQLMPATAAELAMTMDVDGPPYSANDNLRMGAKYLAQMMMHRKGDVDLALLSYRLGPTRVTRDVHAAGGVDPYLEMLRNKPKSAWGYRDQVVRMRGKFEQRAREGSDAWSAAEGDS